MESIAILFFLLQQLGVALGVGASTFALMFYIVGTSDGVVDASERRFMHAVYTTLRVALFLIIVSGIAITSAHYLAGDFETLRQPAFLFKWLLLLIIVLNAVCMDLRLITPTYGGVFAGGSWFALFIVHSLSPVTSWGLLLVLYAFWLLLFWAGFTVLRRHAITIYKKEGTTGAPVSKPSTTTSAVITSSSPQIDFSLNKPPLMNQ